MGREQALKVLQQKIKQLRAEAERLEQDQKPGMRQLRAVLRKYKLNFSDVKTVMADLGPIGRASKLSGRKVMPKYRNLANKSETWTGRGRMPIWMATLVKNGSAPSDFLIDR
jgi:DNA-binding protein H-NS